MSASAAGKVKKLEVYYFERMDVMDIKKLFKTLGLILRKKLTFRGDKLGVKSKAFVFQRELDQRPSLLRSSHCKAEVVLQV